MYGHRTTGASARQRRFRHARWEAGKKPARRWISAVSAIVRLRPSPAARFDIGDDGALRTLVTAAFSHRRKTLRNSLKGLLAATDIEACGIDPGLRPETLAPAQFGLLAAHYSRQQRDSRQSA